MLHKKLQVLMAKRTLISERLEAYEWEKQLRDKEQAEKEEKNCSSWKMWRKGRRAS